MALLKKLGLGLGILALLGYTAALGIYAVASTRPAIPSQPRDAAEARQVIRRLGVEDVYGFEHGFVATPHGRMHYGEAGRGDPVLCLHGNPTWSFLYRELIPGLSDEVRLVAPDLIGFGLSEKLDRPGDYSIAGHIADVSALVETLDLDDITLVVQDWGGPIGVGVMLKHPERFRALVVLNTMAFNPVNGGAGVPGLGLLRAPGVGEQLVQGVGVVHRLFVPAAIVRPERRNDWAIAAYREVQGSWSDRAATLALLRSIPRGSAGPVSDLLARSDAFLRKLEAPALIVWGMRDPVLGPEVLAGWRQRLPQAEVLELADAGHFVQEDAPDVLRSRLARFLREHRQE